jgi:ring-1,2-phenylacetyl-CoA epoxidase subunit PaaE
MSGSSRHPLLQPWLDLLPTPAARRVQRSPLASQALSDLAMMVQVLSPRPLPVAARFGAPARSTDELWLTVVDLHDETHDTRTVLFARPQGWQARPGQFVTFTLWPKGASAPLRRSYSLSHSPAAGAHEPLAVTVKRVPGGAGSKAMTELRVGDRVRARGPLGSFVLGSVSPGAGSLVLVAGGAGITPIAPLAEEALAAGREVTLLYGARSLADAIFLGRLRALTERFTSLRVSLHLDHAPSADALAELRLPSRLSVHAGRMGREHLALAVRPGSVAYVCGPSPMMAWAAMELASLGVASDRLRQERFGSPGGARPAEGRTEGRATKLRVHGKSLTVLPSETLLEASQREGAPLESSCAMGGCGACRMRLVSGEVELDEPHCLTATEREAGIVLTCVARAKSDVVLSPIGGAS